MNDLKIWKFILDEIKQGKNVTLTVVCDSELSSPGKQGFKMAIADNKNTCGSIGGGIMEYDIIENHLSYMNLGNNGIYFKDFKHFGNNKDSTGMICNGMQTIAFIEITISDLIKIENIIKSITNKIPGKIVINADSFTFQEQINEKILSRHRFAKSKFIYEEFTGIKDTAYIFGGGHVGLAISKVLKLIDFHIIVIDNRNKESVSTISMNKDADEIITEDYIKYSDNVRENDFSYIIIVTPSHQYDEDVLKAVINKKVRYIGMMGSKSKVKIIFNNLKREGYPQELINSVHSPIGIKINSRTPEEIAVSIAAEIIKIKNS